jgi:hypothetical protein
MLKIIINFLADKTIDLRENGVRVMMFCNMFATEESTLDCCQI